MNPRNRNILIAVIVVVIVVVAGFFAFSGNKKKSASSKTVNIGIITPTKADQEVWDSLTKTAKDKYGITIKYTVFTDYTQPNKALASGSIDLNAFQHYAFLNAWNSANKGSLEAIGDTYITPIHLYSNKIKSVSELADGATVAIPNDASNESRALYLLEGEGLIKLNVSGDKLAGLNNVTENKKNLNLKELDASQTARALDSVDAAVINQNYAAAANLSADKSIAAEPLNSNSHQWINILVANKKDKDNAVYQEVVKAFQTKATEDAIKKAYPDGSELAAWNLKLK